MVNEKISISDELIDNLSIENLVDLKMDIDDLNETIENLIETCDEILNS